MIAYFILVHRYPEQFKRLFRSIYLPGNSYVVHVDRSSGSDLADDIATFLAPYQGVQIFAAQSAQWGGYSLVDAELRGMAALLAMDDNWTHYINLSGQDFPLKSQRYITAFFRANPGKQFICAARQDIVRPDTMNRLSHFFVELFGKVYRTGIRRRMQKGTVPYIGTQWKAVTREFCAFVVGDKRVDRLKRFYRYSFIADEAFFQTAMMNTPIHGSIVDSDLRTIDWIPDGDIKLRPRTFGVADFAALAKSSDMFARKFDETEDADILALLEEHLKTASGDRYFPGRQSFAAFPALQAADLLDLPVSVAA